MPSNKKLNQRSKIHRTISTQSKPSPVSLAEIDQQVQKLKELADQKTASYELIAAVDLYTQALDLLQSNQQEQPLRVYDLLDHRANCHYLSGNGSAEGADLEAMAHLIEPFDDPFRKADLYSRKTITTGYIGNLPEARKEAEASILFARQAKNHSLEMKAFNAMGRVLDSMGNLSEAKPYYEQSLAISREIGDQIYETRSLLNLSWLYGRLGQFEQAQTCSNQGIEIAYRIGDRVLISQALNSAGLTTVDSAIRRNYYEQALALVDTPDFIHRQSTLKNNLSLVYHHTGLYKRADPFCVRSARESPPAQCTLYVSSDH